MLNRRRFFSSVFAAAAVSLMPMAVTGCTSSDIDEAISIAQTAIPAITAVIQIVLPLVVAPHGSSASSTVFAPTPNVVVQYLQDALAEVPNIISALNDYKNSATSTIADKVVAALNAVQKNLTAALQAVNFTDPAKLATITDAIAVVKGVLVSILSLIPNATTSLVTASRNKAKMHSVLKNGRKDFVTRFNAVLVKGGYPQHVIA